jgi:radical SAM superfamily enzyme YgiQ (UPF0313 family)
VNKERTLIVLIEPVSKNIGMYVPAYPLPLMEIGSYVKSRLPEVDLRIISIPMDYGLPLSRSGKKQVYHYMLEDIIDMKPNGIGISCTAISQAEEVIALCNLIKSRSPNLFIFLGGYFPTIYYREIFSKTSSIDMVVIGEGETPALKIVELLERGKDPKSANIAGTAWHDNGYIKTAPRGNRFNMTEKAYLDLRLLKNPLFYDVLPYSFSRGCPYKCNFCMEDHIRPIKKKVPENIMKKDLANILEQGQTRTLLISDALFESFEVFPLLRSLGAKVNFETRCDTLPPSIIHEISDVCIGLAIGFESASYDTLRRMNKVRNRTHYRKYLSNTMDIFKEAVRCHIPVMVFMIAGYPGDTEKDLKQSLDFARELSKHKGPGGYIFKIGECRVYPKTKIYEVALSLPHVVFDNDGVFGQNIVRNPSKDLNFETILDYMREIFNLSSQTTKLENTVRSLMPFFRLPPDAIVDNIVPDKCFTDRSRNVFNVCSESLSIFKGLVPQLAERHTESMSKQRDARDLDL